MIVDFGLILMFTGEIGSWKGCGVLCQLTGAIVHGLEPTGQDTKQELLQKLTKPFTELVIQVNELSTLSWRLILLPNPPPNVSSKEILSPNTSPISSSRYIYITKHFTNLFNSKIIHLKDFSWLFPELITFLAIYSS
jgi:hypothetical protein